MHPFPPFRSLLHLIIHLHVKWKTQTLPQCVYRSHWSHNWQSDLVNCTPSRTVSCFFINYIAVNCGGTPRSLSNGQRSYSGTTFGYTVTYTCNSGYRMTAGSTIRTCQSDGQWSGSHPTCTRKFTLFYYIYLHIYQLQTCKIVFTCWLHVCETSMLS